MPALPAGTTAVACSFRKFPQTLPALALAMAFLALALEPTGDAQAQALPLTTTARLLAGIDPGGSDPSVARITSGDAWQQHRKAARAGARQLKARLERINQWQAQHLKDAVHGGTLLYPFSGPDFINAYAMFPEADTYVFFSLEPPGAVPQLERLDAPALAGLFGDLRSALNDLVALNFFITPNMKERLQTDALQGTVPVLLAMMGLLDLQVDDVQPFDPWPERTQQYSAGTDSRPGPHPELLEQGVRMTFTNPHTGRRQLLVYLALDVSDRQLKYYPDFLPWLSTFPHPEVLLKSASYLLHGEHFRQLRKTLVEHAEIIVQDDTGLPFKAVRDAGFGVTLFGQYEHPVKLFEARLQPDLEAAYEKAGNPEPLPFPFGYNWRKEGKSGLLVARRDAAPH